MKIERDKWYMTRGGEKVRVVCVDAGGAMPVVVIHGDGDIYTHRADGAFSSQGESGLDLVSEYVEPPKPREVWVNPDHDSRALCAYTPEALPALGQEFCSRLVKFREVIEA